MSFSSASPTLSLLRSAFGPEATLYTVLDCERSATPAELKRAYRKAALRHHPDRCHGVGDRGAEASSTLKFQAVSAAYQILADERQRSGYDRTGRVADEDDGASCDEGSDDEGVSAPRGKAPRASRRGNQSQQQWEQFFQSVFGEMVSTGARHATAAKSYRGSAAERRDVLHYYDMCKGDLTKVVGCVLHGTPDDIGRWRREIVDPAIARGEVERFGSDALKADKKGGSDKKRRRILEDSSSDEDDEAMADAASPGEKRPETEKSRRPSLLVDTDDEEDGAPSTARLPRRPAAGKGMSKRDKMNYRVAKKRKAKAAKEMEIAEIIQSKNWDADAAADQFRRRSKKRRNVGGLSDALLSNIAKKYGRSGRKKK